MGSIRANSFGSGGRGRAAVGLTLLLGACLPDNVPASGHSLAQGRPYAKVEMGAGAGGPWVVYTQPNPDRSDVGASWVVPFAGGAPRLLAERRWLPAPVAFQPEGKVLLMHDPRLLPSATPDRPWGVAALARIDLATGAVEEDNPEVLGFSTAGGRFFFRRGRPGAAEAELVMSDGGPRRRELGPAWAPRFGVDDTLYFVQPKDNSLARLRDTGHNLELLHADVGSFALSPDGRWVVLQEIGTGTAPGLHWAVELSLLRSRLLPFTRPCKDLGFSPKTQRFACSYREPTSGATRIELADPQTNAHEIFEPPTRDANFAALVWRPDEEVAIAVAASPASHSFALRPHGEPRVQDLGPLALPPVFTADGGSVLYVRADVIPVAGRNEAVGALMIADAGLATPARVLSPEGYLVAAFTVLEGGEVAITAAGYADGYADLFVAPLAGGSPRLLASHVKQVIPAGRRILATVRYTSQDRTADLVLFDRAQDREIPVADSVADFAVVPPAEGEPLLAPGAAVTFILRDRVATTREGVWATRLP